MTWLGCFRRHARAVIVAGAVAAAGCFSSGTRPDNVLPPSGPAQLDLTVSYQRIDGFGASSAWTAGNINDTLAEDKAAELRSHIKPVTWGSDR